ncbi:MAG: nucleotide sugar dehydrogenase [Bacteroidota bacterium]
MKIFDLTNPATLSDNGKALAEKVQSKQSVIGIIGLGYVGLPIGLEYAKKGYPVLGVDVSEEKVNLLNAGTNYNEDLSDEEIADVVAKGHLSATTDFARLAEADVIFIAVPTPFNENKDPDLGFVLSAGRETATILRQGQLVILKSTTFPGTTEDYLVPILEASGLKTGVDYFVAFSPERVDPGNKVYHTGNTPIVVGGVGEESTYLASLVNHAIIDNVYMVTNPKIAELEKLLENIFRSVNIALVNELALLCERMDGINIWEVIEAASTKPFGFMKFTPGPGIGGHCIPIDPYYLSWLARAYDFETRFITLSANTNESMPYHVVTKIIRLIAEQPITLKDAKVLVLGAAFKKNVKDLRHSPAEPIIEHLVDAGVTHIDVSDPWVEEYEAAGRTFTTNFELTPERLGSYHCVVIVTDHDAFDIAHIVAHARHVVDTRNMTRDVATGREKITLLGSSL